MYICILHVYEVLGRALSSSSLSLFVYVSLSLPLSLSLSPSLSPSLPPSFSLSPAISLSLALSFSSSSFSLLCWLLVPQLGVVHHSIRRTYAYFIIQYATLTRVSSFNTPHLSVFRHSIRSLLVPYLSVFHNICTCITGMHIYFGQAQGRDGGAPPGRYVPKC